MQLRTFFLIGAALGLGYGLAFLAAPHAVFALYGGKGDNAVVLGYRYFAVALICIGLICWFVRDCRDPEVVQSILISHGIADVVGIFVSAWGTTTGTLNALGWMNVLLYIALAAGCLYFYRGMARTARFAS